MWICSNCGFRTEDDSNDFCGKCGNKHFGGEGAAFDVILVGFDPAKKINVIKNIREMTSCGLKDAKDFVENTPQIIGSALTSQNADLLISKLNIEGAICEKCVQNTRQIYRPMPVQPVQNNTIQSGFPANKSSVASSGCTTGIISFLAIIGLIVLLLNMINL
ncbi:MAG: bL12 family ribosomal protein [bacterium]